MTSLGLLICTLIAITNAGQQFVASPTILEFGLVKELQMECTATKDNTLSIITQIRILFTSETGQYANDLLGSVDTVSGIDNSSGAVDFGEIVGNGTSKLRLKWNYPNEERAGVYTCEVKGKIKNGVPKMSQTVQVTAVVPDQISILNYIQEISSDLEDLKASFAKQELILSELTDRLERGKTKFFRVSNVFQGRRYYLSADTKVLVNADAEAMCEIFGGYLVEIDSAEEHQFIIKFLGNFPQYQMVLTGGSDEVLENNWINKYSKTAVKYIDFWPGEPNQGRGANCLYLYSAFGWKMADHFCYKGDTDLVVAYLCEIKE